MRSAGNFSPEWGYLAPVPSFARTARIVLVATAIGATAGAGVVLSLVDRPAQPERTPVAARAIVTSARAAPAPAAPEISAAPVTPAAAPVSVPAASPTPTVATSEVPPARPQATPPAPSQPANVPTAVSSTADHPPVQASAPIVPPAKAERPNVGQTNTGQPNAGPTPARGIAALSEPAATGAAAPADAPDAGTPVQEPVPGQKKTKHHGAYGRTPFVGLGTLFRRFFVAHAGRSYYPNR